MHLGYRFRLEPQPSQETLLAMAFGCARVVYNDALALQKQAYEQGEGFLSDGTLYRRLVTEAKRTPERSWLSTAPSIVLTQAIRDLQRGYRNYFDSIKGRRKGPKIRPPKFRSRKEARQSIRFGRTGFSLQSNGRLYLARIGEVPIIWSRPLPANPSSVTIVRDAAGRYFATFVVVADEAADRERFPKVLMETGVDLGLSTFAALSDGSKVASPKVLRRAEDKLKRLQRDMCRKQKGSANRDKARVKLARQHAKVADSRRDFHHKLSTTLIRENQAVYVENLAVNGLARTRLAKSVHDAGWSAFVYMLEYKAARYGRTFAKVDRWAPTSQVCSACGVKDGKKPLNVREWTCAACGAAHDRDVNAAKNILMLGKQQVAAGRAETLNACGGDVRPQLAAAGPDEAGTRPGDCANRHNTEGIPAT